MTDREKYEMNLYMRGWDACLKGAKKENFSTGHAGTGFSDCEAGKPLPYWYNRWVAYRKRRAAHLVIRS